MNITSDRNSPPTAVSNLARQATGPKEDPNQESILLKGLITGLYIKSLNPRADLGKEITDAYDLMTTIGEYYSVQQEEGCPSECACG